MSLGLSERDSDAVMMVARGAEALTMLKQLNVAIEDFQRLKDVASTSYQRAMDYANAALATTVSGLVLTAQRRIDALEESEATDDDDDD